MSGKWKDYVFCFRCLETIIKYNLIIWKGHPTGLFRVRSGYSLLERVSWPWKYSKAPLKVSCFTTRDLVRTSKRGDFSLAVGAHSMESTLKMLATSINSAIFL